MLLNENVAIINFVIPNALSTNQHWISKFIISHFLPLKAKRKILHNYLYTPYVTYPCHKITSLKLSTITLVNMWYKLEHSCWSVIGVQRIWGTRATWLDEYIDGWGVWYSKRLTIQINLWSLVSYLISYFWGRQILFNYKTYSYKEPLLLLLGDGRSKLRWCYRAINTTITHYYKYIPRARCSSLLS